MTHCNFPGQDVHPLTKTYWQVPGLGDICDPCHRDWLREQEQQAVLADSECECGQTHTANTARKPQHPNHEADLESRGLNNQLDDVLDAPHPAHPKPCDVIAIHDANPNNLAGVEHVLWAEKECGCKDCLRAAAIIEGALAAPSIKPPPSLPKPHPSRASRFTFKVLCRREPCDNQARYDSGYCGVCDITENGGRGERIDW